MLRSVLNGLPRRRLTAVLTVSILAAVLPAAAQRGGGRPPRGGGFRMGGYVPALAASPYDGKFAIVRLWYPTYPGWSYDYPDMDQHLNLILPELTAITPSHFPKR